MSEKIYKIVFFVIGILTMGYMAYSLGLENLWENIRKTGWWFAPVIGSWVIIYLFNAFAFRSIIQEPSIPASNFSFWKVLQLTISGYAINYITPFIALGGEPYRILELKPALGAEKASSSVLLYSLMHMFSHVLFWLASIVLIFAVVPLNHYMEVGCAVMLVIGTFLCFWFIRVYNRGFTVSTVRLLTKIPFVKNKASTFLTEKQDLLSGIDEQIKWLYNGRRSRFFTALFWEFLARTLGSAEIYFSALAIGMDISVSQALIVSSGSSLFANVIFFFPMQLGTREGGLALALKSIGLPSSGGIIIGIIMRIRELVWIGIGLALMAIWPKLPQSADQKEQKI
ncbi:Lysylphosphatidylglycerol synthase TM region [bacterium A37T11]|nr:Lysylphosphatidylglycerol synthase TM region [bacterium A37T11]